jgi:nitroreductase
MIKKIIKRVISSPSILASSPSVLALFARWRFLSATYYILLSRSFGREQQAVIYGRLEYLEGLGARINRYLLRRNIHRLEKGLLMRPRREIFALGYILETVECYEKIITSRESDSSIEYELQWAHDVLEKYFSVVSSHQTIDEARRKFLGLDKPGTDGAEHVPYKRDLSTPSPVSYEALLKLARRRKSVRWYLPKPVPRELIDKAVSIAALSPSACNRQPFQFYIFDEVELVQKVAEMPMGTQGFSHNIPVVVAVVGRLRAYFSERDRHLIYIDGALAAMSFMYALETLGLASCPINWPDMEHRERKMAKLLGLELDERVIMLISLGYPDPEGMVAYSQKKALGEILSYNLS